MKQDLYYDRCDGRIYEDEDNESDEGREIDASTLAQVISSIGYGLVLSYGIWLHMTMDVKDNDGKYFKGFWDLSIRRLSPQVHAVMMTLLYVLVGQMMLIYNIRMCPDERRCLHGGVASIATLILLVAIKAAYDTNKHFKDGEKGIYSFHSKLGMLGILIFLITNVLGMLMRCIRPCHRRTTETDHKYAATVLFLFLTIQEQLGIFAMSRYNCGALFNRFDTKNKKLQCLMAIKILHAFYGLLVLMTVYLFPLEPCQDPCSEADETSI